MKITEVEQEGKWFELQTSKLRIPRTFGIVVNIGSEPEKMPANSEYIAALNQVF